MTFLPDFGSLGTGCGHGTVILPIANMTDLNTVMVVLKPCRSVRFLAPILNKQSEMESPKVILSVILLTYCEGHGYVVYVIPLIEVSVKS